MPRILSEVLGHDRLIESFLSAWQRGRLPSTWLFTGPSGVGKKKTALGFAQALVCENDQRGCGKCPSCLRISQKQSESLLFIEPEGVSIKIEQAREILRFTSLQAAKSRIVIIDEAQKMNATAANALLKTLEEPPEDTYFFLITSSLAAILPTIRSRSQVLRFSPLSREDIKKQTGADDWIVAASGGSLEQVEFLQSGDWADIRQVAFGWLRRGLSEKPVSFFAEVKDTLKDKDAALFVAGIYQRWARDVYHHRAGGQMLSWPEERDLTERASSWPETSLRKLWNEARRLEGDVRGHVDRTLSFENFLWSWSEGFQSR